MKPDHYATLGIAPSSTGATIRAAYRSLMRRYHPDLNRDPEAETRVRELTAAYSILRDPERRAEYDQGRAVDDPLQALDMSGGLVLFPPVAPPAARGLALAALAAAGLAVAALWHARDEPAAAVSTAVEAPTDPVESSQPKLAEPAELAAIQRTASGPALGDPVPHPGLDPVEEVEVEPAIAPRPEPRRLAGRSAPEPARQRPPQAAPAACRGLDCGGERIAALERHSAILVSQSLTGADPVRRARLQASLAGFRARLETCASEPCLAQAYLAHFRDFGEIMEKGARP